MTINVELMQKSAGTEYSTATELADWLVKNLDIPFRKAHELTGKIVKLSESKSLQLWELPLSELQRIEPKITKDAQKVLLPCSAVQSRNSFGGTSPDQVKIQINDARERFL